MLTFSGLSKPPGFSVGCSAVVFVSLVPVPGGNGKFGMDGREGREGRFGTKLLITSKNESPLPPSPPPPGLSPVSLRVT